MEKFTLDTSKRIKLGAWGLRRGSGLCLPSKAEPLGIDIVAGCDLDEDPRKLFSQAHPDAFVTDDAEKFLNHDMDAVLLTTFSTDHAADTLRCIDAGKHVLSETTSFHTMAEGVEVVEAVEKSGLVYNLAENYPFTKNNMFLEEQYKKGLFGELEYAEFEYVHNCLTMAYCTPVQPGNSVHHWRSWMNFHYYNTHSLGPIMNITGLRPERVVSLHCEQGVPGFLDVDYQGAAPSLIKMSNGGLFRNLMGAMSGHGASHRLYGTRGAAISGGGGWNLTLGGGSDGSNTYHVTPQWPEGFGEMAEKAGHGGSDFWNLYFFAREIREGTPGPFPIYKAADCTSAGILAFRSAMENGKTYDIPDFSIKSERDRWRNDTFAQTRYNVKKGCFPANADEEMTKDFARIMRELISHSNLVHSIIDTMSIVHALSNDNEKDKYRKHIGVFMEKSEDILKVYKQARIIADTYPESDGARIMRDMLAHGHEQKILEGSLIEMLKRTGWA